MSDNCAEEKWTKYLAAAQRGARAGVHKWCQRAWIKGMVSGAILRFEGFYTDHREGGLLSTTESRSFGPIAIELQKAGMFGAMAENWEAAVANPWEIWSRTYKCVFRAYPSLDEYPQEKATNVKNVPFPLSRGESVGLSNLRNPGPIAEYLRLSLRNELHEPAARRATTEFANWFSTQFYAWYVQAMITDVSACGNGHSKGFFGRGPYRIMGNAEGKGFLAKYSF